MNTETLLALDTAHPHNSLALLHQGHLWHHRDEADAQHSRVILQGIDALLHSAGISLSTVDAILLNHGPGSFTGLRIGAGVALGLATAKNLPLLGLSSLEMLAEQARLAHGVQEAYVLSDARMHEVYCAFYRHHDNAWQLLGQEQVLPAASIRPVAEASANCAVILCGEVAPASLPPFLQALPTYPIRSDASALLSLFAAHRGELRRSGEFFELSYIRNQVVQI